MANISTSNSSDIRTDYMTLLITQLQNQNPLEPMDNDQMAAQLAQFSQLEQLENLNTRFADVLNSIDQTQAHSLLGKEISFRPKAEDGSVGDPTHGFVEEIEHTSDDTHLLVGNYKVNLSDILSVKNP